MMKFQNKKQRLPAIALVSVLCLSLFAGNVTAISGCNAACCIGNQMDGHEHMSVRIVDDHSCPCCSASNTCTIGKSPSPMTFAAVHQDCQRPVSPYHTEKLLKFDVIQTHQIEWLLPLTSPPAKIPIYMATLNLIC